MPIWPVTFRSAYSFPVASIPAVANLAQRTSKTSIHTFTLAFDEAEFNEGRCGENCREPSVPSIRNSVLTEPLHSAHLDAAAGKPRSADIRRLNSYYVSKAVRQAGFNVALAGTGGDELFGGYTSFRDLPALARWSKRTGWIPNSMRTGAARLRRPRSAGRRHDAPADSLGQAGRHGGLR